MDAPDFTPRWASRPGDTIRDIIAERKLTVDEFASLTRLSQTRTERLLDGAEPITLDLARRLADSLGASPSFWMARDGQFRDDANLVAADQWAETLPVLDMIAFGWIERPASWPDRVTECLAYFGVSDKASWDRKYGAELASAKYRTSQAFGLNPSKIAVWLRAAERAAEDALVGTWSPDRLIDSFDAIRRLTWRRDPQTFLPELSATVADAGVIVSLIRAPHGCPVSGAARVLDSGARQVVLSGRFLSDDHLWFTFFHETAHLLLHSTNGPFVDQIDQATPTAVDGDEAEADDFASRTLVPANLIEEASDKRALTARRIVSLARQAGVSPGVLVGQLQHVGKIGFGSGYNRLKRRYKWNGISLERA
jgi:HTH-type transcriptional regulator / antitoxin HigA